MVRGNAKDLTVPPAGAEEFAFLARRLGYTRGPDGRPARERLGAEMNHHLEAVRGRRPPPLPPPRPVTVAGSLRPCPTPRAHRGPHPRDADHFAPRRHAALRTAAEHLSWLLSRGYVNPSALKLVGDRFDLTDRQRTAVLRSACPDAARADRAARRLAPTELAGRTLRVDGFNLVTTVEAALAGGVLLRGRDGVLRDMASMHGNYRRVAETLPALAAIRTALDRADPAAVHWLLDRPVSNSGRLAGWIRDAAGDRPWTVRCVPDPDALLLPAARLDEGARLDEEEEDDDEPGGFVAITADAGVLDRCGAWCDLAGPVAAGLPGGGANLVDLSDGDGTFDTTGSAPLSD